MLVCLKISEGLEAGGGGKVWNHGLGWPVRDTTNTMNTFGGIHHLREA